MRNKDILKEAKDGNEQKLKKRIKKLEKENKGLKSELNAYEQAFKKTTKFLRDNTDDISVEDLIQAAKSDTSLKKTKENKKECPKCFSKNVAIIESLAGTVISCPDCEHRELRR